MKTIEKIRQKIEELYDGEAPAHDQQCEFEDGYFTGIATISNFLDTLESEKPMNQEGLEEEIKSWIPPIKVKVDEDVRGIMKHIREWGELIARHFAKWGAENLKK